MGRKIIDYRVDWQFSQITTLGTHVGLVRLLVLSKTVCIGSSYSCIRILICIVPSLPCSPALLFFVFRCDINKHTLATAHWSLLTSLSCYYFPSSVWYVISIVFWTSEDFSGCVENKFQFDHSIVCIHHTAVIVTFSYSCSAHCTPNSTKTMRSLHYTVWTVY